MCLPDTVGSDQAQAFRAVRKGLGKPAHRADCVDELLVRIDLEILEIATPIARGDPRLFKQPAGVLALPALTAHDTTDTSGLYRFPTGVVTDGAGHCNAEC